jgi:hypothetical protein
MLWLLTELLSGMLEEPLLPVHVCVKAMGDNNMASIVSS